MRIYEKEIRCIDNSGPNMATGTKLDNFAKSEIGFKQRAQRKNRQGRKGLREVDFENEHNQLHRSDRYTNQGF